MEKEAEQQKKVESEQYGEKKEALSESNSWERQKQMQSPAQSCREVPWQPGSEGSSEAALQW